MSFKKRKFLTALAAVTATIVLFQNCGPGFQALSPELLSSSSGTLSGIVDIPANPAAPLSVYVRNVEARQGSDLSFNVELNKVSESPVTIDLRTKLAAGQSDIEFSSQQGTVTIAPGQLRSSFNVATIRPSAALTDKSVIAEIVSANTAAVVQKEAAGLIRATQKIENFSQVASGGNFSCGITLLGAVKCWGGTFGRVPAEIAGLSGIKQIAAGLYHACGITAGNTVKCWGSNTFGELGNGSNLPSTTAVDVLGSNGAALISLGAASSCGLFTNGVVRCWGSNFGLSPTELTALSGSKHIALSNRNGCAVAADDTVKCWGYQAIANAGVFLPPTLNTIQNVAAAKKVSVGILGNGCALSAQNTVQCWSTTQATEVPGLTSVVEIAVIEGGGCALTDLNVVKCFGGRPNTFGQGSNLGQTPDNGDAAVRNFIGLTNIRGFSFSFTHACATNNLNQVLCWGQNSAGQLGNSTQMTASIPVAITGLGPIKQLASGENLTCAITSSDTVKCWGNNTGMSWTSIVRRSAMDTVPIDLPNFGTVKQVAVGFYHVCAVTMQNTLKCAGYNGQGQLGVPINGNANLVPVDVPGVVDVTRLIAGNFFTCASTAQKKLFCWGEQFGNGGTPTEQVAFPDVVQLVGGRFSFCTLNSLGTVLCLNRQSITGLTDIKQITMGSEHVCGITLQNTVRCAGPNALGQLGNNSRTPNYTSAVDVVGLTGIRDISAGAEHTCALDAAGAVSCWGSNKKGGIGIPFGEDSLVPVALAGIKGIQRLFGGMNTTKLIRADSVAVEIGDRYHMEEFNNYGITNLTPLFVTSPQP